MLQPCKIQHIIQIVTVKQLLILKNTFNQNNTKTAGAVLLQTASTSTEKLQLFCNTHIYTVCYHTIMSFHQPGTGR